MFKFDDSGKHLLIGLAGDDRKIITVTGTQTADEKAQVNANINDEEETPLHVAAREGDTDTVRELLKHGTDVNARNDKGWTSLHLAAREGQIDTARELLKHGADVNARDDKGRATLHIAAEYGHADVIQELLNNGTGQTGMQ